MIFDFNPCRLLFGNRAIDASRQTLMLSLQGARRAPIYRSRGTMRTIRDDDSKTVEPKKKIDAKIKTVRLRANLKLTHWHEKAALSISAAQLAKDS